MTGYTRKDTTNNIADGNIVNASDLDNEFDGVVAAFNASTGHTHGGAVGEGAPILTIGPTQDVTASATLLAPKTTNTVDIGSTALKFKDLYLAGAGSIGGALSVTGATTLSSALTYGGVTLSNAVTGTGNMVLSNSPTLVTPALGTPSSGTVTNLTGTASININGTVGATTANTGAFTTLTTSSTVKHNGGTANGVAYLNGSKALTTGSALTFDGTTLSNTGSGDRAKFGTGSRNIYVAGDSGGVSLFDGAGQTGNGWYISGASNYVAGYVSSSEQMRLTSTGLGIGTSSPAAKLDVVGAGVIKLDGSGSTTPLTLRNNNTASTQVIKLAFDSNGAIKASINAAVYNNDYMTFNVGSDTERMRLDSAGNLGLGVTPSAGVRLQLADSDVIGFKGPNGYLVANAYYSGGWKYAATGNATQYLQTAGQHQWITAPSGTAGNAITFTQAMTLDASGNLLVGDTSNPGFAKLHAKAASGEVARFSTPNGQTGYIAIGRPDATTEGALLGYNSNNGEFNIASVNTSHAIVFRQGGIAGTERARIDSAGNLLVGKTSAGVGNAGFEVGNTGALFSSIASSTNSNSTLHAYSTTAGAYRFYVGMAGTVFATSTSITAISDATLKENIRDLETGLTEVLALKPRRFDWKAETQIEEKNVAGFIAQEVNEVLPELVYDYQYSAGETKKSLKMGDMVPTLVKAIQEQQALVIDLQTRLAAAGI